MPRANDEVAALLFEYVDLLAILSDDPFKPRAYEKAARAVSAYPADIAGFDAKQLLAIPAVGKSIADKVAEYLRDGQITDLEQMREQIPGGVRDLMSIPGLGPKKAMLLYEERNIGSIDDLERALDDGSLAGLKGFGAKTEDNIRRGLGTMKATGGRMLLGEAMDLAELIVEALRPLRQVRRISYAGSLRRMAETIGDLDVLVASDKADPIMDAFVELPAVNRVLAHGETKASIVTSVGRQVDLRVVPLDVWGAAMFYFTGSKAHNVRIREIAVRRGLKLSEYGLFQAKSGDLLAAETEEDVYEAMGMPWVAPTLREDRGEIEAALEDDLPTLVELRQIRGDLHAHTKLTDGQATLEEMVAEAESMKYRYLAITDHAPDLAMQRMTDAKILDQRVRLRELDEGSKVALLHGTELNIGPDGAVDWPAEFLEGFDITVASVHSHFNQSRDEMTRRFLAAIENPFVNIIGHPTARRIGVRDAVEVDLEAIFEAAGRTGTAMEINAHPDRLDLSDEHVLWARRHGVRFAINTDAHAVGHLHLMRYGVGVAQRGWLGPDEVINTWPITKLRTFLRKGR